MEKPTLMIGSWINTASEVVAEVMAGAGFDFLVVDAEHSAVDVPQALRLFQAMKAGNQGCAPMVRLAGNSYAETKRYLDAGATGVIAPLINSPEEARELVRGAKYPPVGERGVGFARCNEYGFSLSDSLRTANDETFVCVQIEHVRGVESIEGILDVSGIDAVFIGPYDLTASMGIPAQFEHPKYKAAVETILSACRRRRVRAGIHVVQPSTDELVRRVAEGFDIIAYSLDITMLGAECRRAVAAAAELGASETGEPPHEQERGDGRRDEP